MISGTFALALANSPSLPAGSCEAAQRFFVAIAGV